MLSNILLKIQNNKKYPIVFNKKKEKRKIPAKNWKEKRWDVTSFKFFVVLWNPNGVHSSDFIREPSMLKLEHEANGGSRKEIEKEELRVGPGQSIVPFFFFSKNFI